MADQNNISDLEKEYEAKINAVVANEAYKASIEESPDSNASLGGTVDISNLLTASKTLSKITESVKNLKDEAGTSKKSGITYGIDYSDIPMARLSRKDRKESESFLDKYKDEIQAVHSKRQQDTLEQFLNTGSSGLLYKAESMLAESSRKQKFKEQMQLFDYNYKNREKGNIRKYQEQLKANGGGVNFTLPNTNLRNLLGNSSAATRIKNENINNERKKDFYIQKQAREIVDEIYKTIQEKRQRESNPISAQSASRLLLTGDAGKYKIAQERFVSGNYMTEAAKHFQFLRQDARNGNRTQDSLEKGLKDSFESKFDSIKEKVTSFFSSGIGRIKDILSGVPQSVKNGASKFSQTRFARYQAVNWGRFAGTTARNFKDWKKTVLYNANRNNMYDGTFKGLLNSTGLGFAKTLTRTIFPKETAEKIIPALGVGAELLKKGAQKLYDAGVEGLKAFGEIQAIQTNLGVVYGNQSEADQMFERLSSYAVKSPFSTSQIANFAVLLKQSGVYSSDIENTLKMLGDTAGGNEEKMSRIANNYAQIVAMGKATSMDLRQFANANIPIYEELKKQLGNVSQKELRQITASGGITSDLIERAFIDMTSEGGRFANATEKGAKTYKAKKTNLADIRQLGMAEFGKLVYERTPVQPIMDFQEWWYSAVKDFSKFWNDKYDLNQVKKSGENYEILTGVLDAIKNQTIATNSNTEALSQLKKDSDTSYRTYIDEARATGTRIYSSKAEQITAEKEKANYAIDILNNISDEDYRKLSKSDFFSNLLKEIGLPTILLEGENRQDSITIIGNTLKRFEESLKKAQKENGGQNYNFFLQSQGVSLARDAAESFGKFSKDKKSSTSIDADVYEMYKQTGAYREEERNREQNRLQEARKLLEKQKSLGINEEDFSWIKNNQNLKTDDIANYLKLFYGNNYLDTASENLSDKTKGIISKNLSNISSVLESSFTGDDQKIIQKLNKELEEALGKKTQTTAEKNLNNQEINKISGKYKEFAKTLKDDTQKILLNALFIDSKGTLIDEKQLEAAERMTKKKVEKIFTPFWKRYAASILNVSIEGLSTQNVNTQLKNENAREINQAIANAMISSGFSPEDTLRMVSYKNPEIYTGGVSGSRGINQEGTAKIYEEFAMSSKATAKVTSAYLQELQRQETQLSQFFSGAAFKREDLDKLYDEEWASELGYTNKESWVNAFDAMTDASGKFTEATLKSVSAIYTEVKKRRENASILSGFKNENETLDDRVNAEKSRMLVNNLYYPDSEQFQKFNALPKTDKTAYLNTLQKVYTENGTKDISRMQKDVSGFFSGTILDSNGNVAAAKNNLAIANKNLQDAKENLAKTQELLNNTPQYVSDNDKKKKMPFFSKLKDRVFGSKTEQVESPSYTEAKANFDSAQTEVNAAQVTVNAAKADLESKIQSATGIDSEIYKEQDNYIDKVAEYNRIQKIEQLREMPGWKELSQQSEWKKEDNPWFRMFNPSIEIAPGNTYGQQEILNAYGVEQGTNFRDYVKARYTNENPDGTLSAGDENTQTYKNLSELKDRLEGIGKEGKELAASLDFSNLDISALEKMEEMVGRTSELADSVKKKLEGTIDSMKESAKSTAFSAIENSWTAIGKSIAEGKDATKGLALAWKDAAKQLLSSISATLTQTGLEIAMMGARKNSKSTVIQGLALAAAGGIAGISAGMLSSDSSSDNSTEENDYEQRVKNLKDALSDLIDQAKTDAEYYQKNLLHKQALSENDYYSAKSISVNDAIITPNGNVISTAPDDYLIATKTPDTLVGNNIQKDSGTMQIEFNPTFNFIDQTTQGVQTDVKESYDENGNISFDIVLKNVVGEAIANGDLDASFNAREYRLRGKSVAW